MSVSEKKQFYKCFSCQAGGNAIHFVAEYEKINYMEALTKVAQKANIKINVTHKEHYNETQKELLELLKEAHNFFEYSLSTEKALKALEYLKKRNISAKDSNKFLIGYAPGNELITYLEKKGFSKDKMINASLMNTKETAFFNNRLTFAIKNEHGDIVGFSARSLEDGVKSKYINSAENSIFKKTNILYN
jgi:DNA primase